MSSIGVLERGEFKIVTHGIPARSCIFFEKKYLPYTSIHPEISFKTIFDFNDENPDDFDIIIDDAADKYPELKHFEYKSSEMKFRVASKSELCGKKLRLKDLWNQKFITMGEESRAHKMLVNACRREGFYPNIAVQTNDLLCYNKYIDADIGIALGRYEPLLVFLMVRIS